MRTRNILFGVVIAVFFSSGASVRAGDTVNLKPKYTPGQKYYLEQDQEIVVNQTMPQGDMKFNIHRIYGFIHQVEDVSADHTVVSLTFDRVSQKFEMGSMMNLSFDSDDPANEDTSEDVATSMTPMLGMPLKLEIDPDQHVKSASGMVELKKKVTKAAGNNQFVRQLSQEFDDDRAKVSYGEARLAMYPSKEVKVGETWKREFRDKHPLFGESIYSYDCKLERIGEENGHKVAIITYDGTVKSAERDPAASQPVEQSSVEGKLKGTGTFDIDQGVLTKIAGEGKTKIRPLSADGKPTSIGMKRDMEVKVLWTVVPLAERAKAKEAAQVKAAAAKKAEEEKKAARKKERDERRAKKKAEAKDKKDGDEEEDSDE